MLEDFPVPASPKSRQLFGFLPSTNAFVLSISFCFEFRSRQDQKGAHPECW